MVHARKFVSRLFCPSLMFKIQWTKESRKLSL